LTAALVGTSLVDLLAACEVSLEICLLHLFTSYMSSSWTADSTEILFTVPLCPACIITFRTAFKSFSFTVNMPKIAVKSTFYLEIYNYLLCSPLLYSK
jgi:hypothetical protein